MAEPGVEAVELNDIQSAAGQRNRSAVSYYFGDRAGLVAAIIDKHRIALNAQRHELLDEFDRSGDGSVRSLIEVGVKPLADLLGDPSGRDFMIIVAAGFAARTAGLFAARQRHADSVSRFNRMLFERLSSSRVARELLVARTVLVVPTLLGDLARQVNRDEITVAQARRRITGIVDFLSRRVTWCGSAAATGLRGPGSSRCRPVRRLWSRPWRGRRRTCLGCSAPWRSMRSRPSRFPVWRCSWPSLCKTRSGSSSGSPGA